MQDQYQNAEDRLPYLGSAPVVGALFRSSNRSRVKTNLMVFLRPVVMRDQESANKLSLDRYDQIRAEQKDLQPINRPLMPIREAPVLPPMRPDGSLVQPSAAQPAPVVPSPQ
jgi:general secretion pathway protein D